MLPELVRVVLPEELKPTPVIVLLLLRNVPALRGRTSPEPAGFGVSELSPLVKTVRWQRRHFGKSEICVSDREINGFE